MIFFFGIEATLLVLNLTASRAGALGLGTHQYLSTSRGIMVATFTA
jgi:hypothetical protein